MLCYIAHYARQTAVQSAGPWSKALLRPTVFKLLNASRLLISDKPTSNPGNTVYLIHRTHKRTEACLLHSDIRLAIPMRPWMILHLWCSPVPPWHCPRGAMMHGRSYLATCCAVEGMGPEVNWISIGGGLLCKAMSASTQSHDDAAEWSRTSCKGCSFAHSHHAPSQRPMREKTNLLHRR